MFCKDRVWGWRCSSVDPPPCLANDGSMIQPQKGKIKNNGFMKYVSSLGSEWLGEKLGMGWTLAKLK